MKSESYQAYLNLLARAGLFQDVLDNRFLLDEEQQINSLLYTMKHSTEQLQEQKLFETFLNEIMKLLDETSWQKRKVWFQLAQIFHQMGDHEQAAELYMKYGELAFHIHLDYADFSPDYERWAVIQNAAEGLFSTQYIHAGLRAVNKLDGLTSTQFVDILSDFLLNANIESNVFLQSIHHAVRIAAWYNPEWDKVANLLSTE